MKRTLALNPNITLVKESATLEINQQVKKLKSQHKYIIHFGFGESPFSVPKAIETALIQHGYCKTYLPGEGLLELRQAIATYYRTIYDYFFEYNDVFIAPGSKESLFQLLYLLDGDLILPSPSWVSYEPQANLLGKTVHRILTKLTNQYGLTAAELDKLCQTLDAKQQKILILNSPNNPTGCCLNQQELKQIADICRSNNIIVISDEIYAGTELPSHGHASMVYAYPEGTIVTAGLSKLFSAGGYRLGFCLIPDELSNLQKAMTTLISETYSCVSAPIQYAAIAAYSHDEQTQDYVKTCSKIHQLAANFLYKEFIAMGLNCAQPSGAFYLMPDFNNFSTKLKEKGIHSDKQLAQILLNSYNVATLPGSDFGMPETFFSLRIASVDYCGDDALQVYHQNPEHVLESTMPNLILGCQKIKLFLSEINH